MNKEIAIESKIESCYECGSKNIVKDYKNGEYVCSNCGLVLQKFYDTGKEWRSFSLEEENEKARAGMPLTYSIHDKGLATSISFFDEDIYGKPLKPEQKQTFHRLRELQKRMRVSEDERTLISGLIEIERMSEHLNLPKNARERVKESASIIFRKAWKEGLIRGRRGRDIATASLYVACKQFNIPKTLDELSEVSGLSKKKIGKTYRHILEELRYSPLILPISSYASKAINEFKKYGKIEELTYKILSAAKEARLSSGRDPVGLVAASIYIASLLTGEWISQGELSKKLRRTEVTIRNRYKEMVRELLFNIEL